MSSSFGRHVSAFAALAAILATGCGDPEGAAHSDVDALQVSKSRAGDSLVAHFDAGTVEVTADARVVDEGRTAITLTVDGETIAIDFDEPHGLVVAEADDFLLDAAMTDALERFAIALNTRLPGGEGIENKVFRMASLYAVHPTDEPVGHREIVRSDDERDWTSLCSQYFRGDWYQGYFDYECNCSWGFCDQCGGSWGSVVGGNNGNNSCYAACGAGCGDGTDYTVDCAIHDGCLNAGYSDYQCLDEFGSASDDYAFAPNCGEYALHFSTSNTNNALQNYAARDIWLYAGQTLDVGTCSVRGAEGSGDTYLRIYSGASNVASNDDSCGLLSRVTYVAPVSGTYQLRAGCWSSGSCSGKASYTIR